MPLWGIAVFFLYALRRVQCGSCGVRVQAIPWAQGKHQLTTTYAWLHHVFRSVAMAVRSGLAHRDLTGITAVGIDELARRRGHRYVTLVYQLAHRPPGEGSLFWTIQPAAVSAASICARARCSGVAGWAQRCLLLDCVLTAPIHAEVSTRISAVCPRGRART